MKISHVDFSRVKQKLKDRKLRERDVLAAIKSIHAQQRWTQDPKHPPQHLMIGTRLENGNPLFVSLDVEDLAKGYWTCRTVFIPDKENYYDEQTKKSN